ncbi:MAG: molecular chaperone HtpG [Ruminiclostridium sp.]|nr:molecular chaperone HtpG [Ruminiclostridium sp.]
MPLENGNISIHTENILPIIKKWLYSEKDIFVRELVSNSNDAISKLKKLVSIGEAQIGEEEKYIIKVIVNKDDKTIKFIDNGIGMTGEEVRKYINQIAFSGAVDFLEKYKDKADEGNQIIGHFGLGFYSAFMVSEKVQIDTLTYQKDEKAVRWTSTGGTEYEMDDSDRTERGTTVTLYLSEDSLEFLEYFKMRGVLEKYCSFLPFEVYLEDAAKKEEPKEKKEKVEEEKTDDGEEAKKDEPKPLNDTHPMWLKNPKDCTEEEYKEFYTKVFHDFNEPLFWIHLNMDYPFNLKGILFFPKLKHEFETNEGQIKLYYNQVFVADNIKEVIPEFLMLLKGVIDCPDLPLNVSRSFLQNDGYVAKISTHITKKVADKLTSIFESERESYNKYWDDINPFVKYGCIREAKFFEKAKDIVIFKTTNGDYVTLKDYLERNKEKHENKVFYVSDEKQQSQYVKIFKEHDMEAVILTAMIDNHFMQFLEMKENNIKFTRIDSDLSDNLKESGDTETDKSYAEELEKLFKNALANDKLKVQVEALKATSVPGMILLSEYSRRMQEMSRMYGGGMDMRSMFPEEQTLVLNRSNHLIKALVKLKDAADKKADTDMICRHIYDLAMMSHKQLEPDAMTGFIERSNQLLARLADIEIEG